MKADDCLRYLSDRAGEWVTITTKETLASLRELRERGEPVEIRFRSGVREARVGGDPHPISLAELAQKILEAEPIEAPADDRCGHPLSKREIREAGTVCTQCGEILKPPEFKPREYHPGDPPPWNKWLPPKQDTAGLVQSTATCPQCGQEYLDAEEHQRTGHGKPGEPQIAPEQEPTYRFPDNWSPTTIRMGQAVVCPHCHGKKRPAGERVVTRKLASGKTEQVVEAYGADTFCHEPKKRGTPCRRCGGWGLVPIGQGGPVPQSTEVMDVDKERERAAREERQRRYAPSAGQMGIDDPEPDPPPRVPARRPGKPKGSRKPQRPVPDPLARPAEPGEGVAGGHVLPEDAGQG